MSYTYKGRQFEILDPNEPLQVGDRIMIRFQWLMQGTYSRAAQWASIESHLDNRPDFEIKSYQTTNEFLDVEILIKQSRIAETPPLRRQPDWGDDDGWGGWSVLAPVAGPAVVPMSLGPVTGGLVLITAKGVAGLAVAVTVYLMFRSAYREVVRDTKQLQQSSEGRMLLSGLGAAGWAALVGVGYIVLRSLGIIKR